jgi:hypothetical protein
LELSALENEIRVLELGETERGNFAHGEVNIEREAAHALDTAANGVADAIGIGEKIASRLLDKAGDVLEGGLGLVANMFGASKPDPVRAKANAEDRAERAERQRIDLSRYMRDEEYRRQIAQRENEERQQRERESYARLQGRER